MDIERTSPASSDMSSLSANQRGSASDMLIWVTGRDGVFIQVNGCAPAVGDPGQTPSLEAYAHTIAVEDRARMLELFREANAIGSGFHTDFRTYNLDGEVRWIRAAAVPRFDADGSLLGHAGTFLDISDKYLELERAASSEAAFRLLVENSSDLISRHALGTGTILYASPSFKRILGLDPAELVGESANYVLLHPDDRHLVEEEVDRQLKAEAEGRSITFRARHVDGHYVWLGTNVTILRHPRTGEKIGSVAVTRDVTTERAAREELKHREERFRSLTTLSSDWYWETDEQDRFCFLAEDAQRSTGPFFDDVRGRTRAELAAYPDEVSFQHCMAQIARRAPFREAQYWVNGADNSLRRVEISGEPIYEGQVFKGYRGIGRDITDRARTAENLAQLADENKALVEYSLDLIALLDPEGHFLRVNAAALDILGYRPEELLGRRYIELLHPLALERVQGAYAGLRTGQNTTHDLESRWLRKDGEVIHMSLSMRWSEQQQLMYATGRDVSERYRIRNQLQRSKDELNSMLDSIGDAFFAIGSDWRITYGNRKAAAFAGTASADGIGKLLVDAVPGLEASDAMVYYRKAMETRERTFFETYWAPTGVWLDVRVYPNHDGLSVYFHDISEKRETELALRKSEQRFKNLFEQAGDSILISDRAMRIRDANERACKELGYTEKELLQLSIRDIDSGFSYPPSTLDTLRAGQTRLFRLIKKRKNGSIFPAEVRISRFEEDGEEFFQSIIRDLTEREEIERKVRESELRFREVIEMTPAGYVLADGAGAILDVNAALCGMAGYAKGELVGLNLDKLFVSRPWDGAAYLHGGPASMQGQEAVIRHSKGHEVHVLLNGTIKRDSKGRTLNVTGLVTDISARKQAENSLEQLATHDTLTGLPNRALLTKRLQQMLDNAPRETPIAVMFVDLDRFKEVNDSFGHEAGDSLLCEVARRLQSALRPTDIIARLGGDEFVVAAHCATGSSSAISVAEKLLAMLTAPVHISGAEVTVGASIGISMYPHDAQTREQLFQSADTAMYRAKAAGRNGYCFFEADMTVAAKARMALEMSLRPALARREFELHYQPRIDLKTMSVVGMEALLRWNHPELGQVPPMQFIPIAEDTGLIDPIGRWALEEACMQARRLITGFGRPLRVSVNLSARQLQNDCVVDLVRGVLEKTGLPPQLLELELTESTLIRDIERTAHLLRDLKKLGIVLAVDDFGTGYSGLAYLRRFPIDVLKLDRSFVLQQDEGISSFEFIKAFVDMAHALKLSVVAEGVETADVLEFLRSASCDEAQGYSFSEPLALGAFESYLKAAGPLD
jgi:diguanylate cyclase (GGDEF)-like protein/PAS domain S-box-containing protein